MTDERTERQLAGTRFGGDLGYDLAHDARQAAGPQPAEAPPVLPVTGTPDYDGDYSYDLAHDIPDR